MASLGGYAARRRVPASAGPSSWDYGRREEDFRRQDEHGVEVARGAVAVGRRVGAAQPAVLGARKVVPGRLAPLNASGLGGRPTAKPETVGPWKTKAETKAEAFPEPVPDPMSLHARLVCMGRVSVAERLPPSRYDS